MPPQKFSLVIPAYNEEESLPLLMEEIDAMLRGSGLSCEILFVNDGSTDGTMKQMIQLRERYTQHCIRILNLNGNYGLSAALDAGFRSATSDVVVSIDSDLQNDPADIPRMLESLEGYDAVIGVRLRRQDGFVKKTSSRIANKVRNAVMGESILDTGCTLKAFRKPVLDRIKMLTGMHRFLPSLLYMEGARVLQLEVNHRPRRLGKSKYYLRNRLLGPLIDLFAVRWMKNRAFHYRIDEVA